MISAFLNELMPLIPRLLAISFSSERGRVCSFSRIVSLLIKFNSSPAKKAGARLLSISTLSSVHSNSGFIPDLGIAQGLTDCRQYQENCQPIYV